MSKHDEFRPSEPLSLADTRRMQVRILWQPNGGQCGVWCDVCGPVSSGHRWNSDAERSAIAHYERAHAEQAVLW